MIKNVYESDNPKIALKTHLSPLPAIIGQTITTAYNNFLMLYLITPGYDEWGRVGCWLTQL